MCMYTFQYSANRTFSQVHLDLSRYLFIMGPVGSGKSSGCVLHCWLNALKQPVQYDGVRRSKYAILRASYPELKSTTIKTWSFWFKKPGMDVLELVYDVPIRGLIRMPHPDGNSSIEMELIYIALDRPEEVSKLQSLEVTGAHVNEAHEVPEEVFQMLKTRFKRYPLDAQAGIRPIDPFIVMDYNGVPTDHWLYNLAEETKPPKHSFYKQPPAVYKIDRGESSIVDAEGNYYRLNPDADNAENLEPDYYEDMIYGSEADWISVMVMNNYGNLRAGKPVYPQYQDHIHYTDKDIKPMRGLPIIIGMDLGLTPAAAFAQLSPTGQLLVFDEIVAEDCSILEFCTEKLKPHLFNNYREYQYTVILDPSCNTRSQNDAKSAMQIVKASGLSFRAGKTNNQTKRREAVVYFLKRLDGLKLGPKCVVLRKGFISEYCYPRLLNQLKTRYKDSPEKNIFSHIHEGLQYAALECHEGKVSPKKRHYESPDETPADETAGY